MRPIRTHYDNLQVKETATLEVIKGAYRYLSQKYHPDRYTGQKEDAERIMRIVNRAYEVLSDPERRRAYDRHLASVRSQQRAEEEPTPTADKTTPPPPPNEPLTTTAPSWASIFLGRLSTTLRLAFVVFAVTIPYAGYAIVGDANEHVIPRLLNFQIATSCAFIALYLLLRWLLWLFPSIDPLATEEASTNSNGMVELWRPQSISAGGIFLSMLVFPWLSRLNWLSLGKQRKADDAFIWIYLLVPLSVLDLAFNFAPLYWWLFVFPSYSLAWYFFQARPQSKYVRSHYGSGYKGKAFFAPLLVTTLPALAMLINVPEWPLVIEALDYFLLRSSLPVFLYAENPFLFLVLLSFS